MTLDEIRFSGLCLCGKNKQWGHALCAPCRKKLNYDESDPAKVAFIIRQFEKQKESK